MSNFEYATVMNSCKVPELGTVNLEKEKTTTNKKNC